MESSSRKRSSASTNTGSHRSVVDYDTEEQLRAAMVMPTGGNGPLSDEMAAMIAAIQDGQPVQKVARTGKDQTDLADELDWILPHFDAATTVEETLEDEIKRLMVLKSYLILDKNREEAFDRITALATRIFDVPVAIITLIDLGRQWHVSKVGVEPWELLRKEVFCNHTILAKSNLLVVPDLTQDFRFCDLPTVKGPPYLRFYAGASLMTPEGYKLGTFCIIDKVTRPHNGFTTEQMNTLADLADMTVKVMVDRRYQLEKERNEDPVQMIAYTAHDLMVPLTGIQLALSLLRDDEAVKSQLGENQLELLNTAASSSDLVIRICQNAVDGLYRLETGPANTTSGAEIVLAQAHSEAPTGGGSVTTQLDDLVRNLHMIVDPIPKKIPCIITLDQSAPREILADDVKVFRAALNLLTYAVGRTAMGTVHLSIRPDDECSVLMFECEDSAPDIPVEQYEYLFQTSHHEAENRVGLSSVASLVTSMDGEYGFRPRDIDASGGIVVDSNGCRRSGSIFWFSIPLVPLGTANVGQASIDEVYDQLPMEPFQLTSADAQGLNTDVPTDPGAELGLLLEMGLDFEAEAQFDSVLNGDHPIDTDKMVADLDAVMAEEETNLDAILAQLVDMEPYPVHGTVGVDDSRDRRRRMLIIDDSTVVRRNLAIVANNMGYEVVHAMDGKEGLRELQESLFDVVFCDFSMPIMDGLTCVSTFREWEKANRPWDRQFIVGISEHSNLNDGGQGQQAGMDMFYPKPITIKTVSDIQANNDVVLRTEKLDEYERSKQPADMTSLTPQVMQVTSNTESSAAMAPPLTPLSIQSSGVQPAPVVQSSICLIAASARMQPDVFPQLVESIGWKVITINDGQDCLKLLQVRIWDAVLIDDDLPNLAGVACVAAFRQWEAQNRTSVQKNVFLVCDGYVPSPSDKSSLIQPPNGCNGVLSRPVAVNDFMSLLQKHNAASDK